MKIKKVVSGLLALSIAVGSMYVVSAKDQYVTRGQVADMLLVAADDYNPNVKKEDIIQGYEDGELHEDWNVTRAEALVLCLPDMERDKEAVGQRLCRNRKSHLRYALVQRGKKRLCEKRKRER